MAKTVLLIDYYPRSISRIRSLLQACGYRMIVAHDAAEGLEEFRNQAPDLTLIQDLLPKGHGYEVCRKMKESEQGHRSPIILLTAPRSGGRRHELLQTRCDDFLEKPFTDDALLAAVRKMLPAAAAPSPPRIAAPTPPAAVPIPFELTADDIGAALDQILPGRAKKKEGEAEVDAAEKKPGDGQRRSLTSFLKCKSKPKKKVETKRSVTKKTATRKSVAASAEA